MCVKNRTHKLTLGFIASVLPINRDMCRQEVVQRLCCVVSAVLLLATPDYSFCSEPDCNSCEAAGTRYPWSFYMCKSFRIITACNWTTKQ